MWRTRPGRCRVPGCRMTSHEKRQFQTASVPPNHGVPTPLTLVRLAAEAMGTRFEFALAGPDERHLRAAGERAIEEIHDAHRRFSLFRQDSLLAHINRTAAIAPVRLDLDTLAMFQCAIAVHEVSGGAFDITLAQVMRAWNLHEDSAIDVPRDHAGTAPGEHKSAGGRAVVPGSEVPRDAPPGMHDLALNSETVTIAFRRPGVALDLGAIAKGHALDVAARCLREDGIEHALLHGGTSSVVAWGDAPSDGAADITRGGAATESGNAEQPDMRAEGARRGWPIAVRVPVSNSESERGGDLANPRPPMLLVTLVDEALGVSAPHGRMVLRAPSSQLAAHASEDESDAPRYGHIIDPRSRSPLRCHHTLAAVLAGSAMQADAWSTALLVLAGRRSDDESGGVDLDATRQSAAFTAAAVVAAGDEDVPCRFRGEEISIAGRLRVQVLGDRRFRVVGEPEPK